MKSRSMGLSVVVLLMSLSFCMANRFEDLDVGVMRVSDTATFASNVTVTGTLSCGITNIITSTSLVVQGPLKVTGVTTNVGAIVANNITLATNLAYSASSGNVTHNGNLTVNTNVVITGTSLHTGVATFTAKPAFNVALTANGALTNGPANLLPAGTSNTNGVWISISHNGTNMVIHAFPQ